MKIHEQLRAYRKFRKITAREVAKRSGISYSTISSIERGHTKPLADTIEALAEALDCDVRLIPRSL